MSTRNRRLKIGVGAKCSVKVRYMHPKKEITSKLPNALHQDVLENLVAVKTARHMVNRRIQTCIFFRHDDFPNIEIYSTKRWVKVNTEGHPTHFFDFDDAPVVQTTDTAADDDDVELPSNMRGRREDIEAVQRLGLDVDDDNAPAPENVPTGVPDVEEKIAKFNTWHGIDHRKAAGMTDTQPTINKKHFETGSLLHTFLLLFPTLFLQTVILKKTNENLVKNNKREVTYGEFLCWIGLWFLMSCTSGYATRQYWSPFKVSVWEGAPYRLNQYMSFERFSDILQSLGYTTKSAPSYADKFWEIRDLLAAWNENMKKIFVPSWVSCLDESISIWFNKFTCPGWTFIPRKPHPFGNEYHTICCGLCGVMFGIELVEGKDKPKNQMADPTDRFGKTCGLLLRLCQTMYGTGKVVILDSGFCVLQALIELKKLGVFAGAVIKKRRYWPRYILGDEIEKHMKDKDVGEADVACGNLDGIKCNVFALKEPEYVMKLMATYGALAPQPGQAQAFRQYEKDGQTVKKQFCYPPPIANHFLYRHAVDDHNNLRHSVPSLEGTWITTRWSNRVFAFVLAISEINAYLVMKFFVWMKQGHRVPTLHQFRKLLAEQLVNNEYWREEKGESNFVRESKRIKLQQCHQLITAPLRAKKYCGNGRWDFGETMYNQLTCTNKNCNKRIRTYCSCSIGRWLCTDCHGLHLRDVYSSDESSD